MTGSGIQITFDPSLTYVPRSIVLDLFANLLFDDSYSAYSPPGYALGASWLGVTKGASSICSTLLI